MVPEQEGLTLPADRVLVGGERLDGLVEGDDERGRASLGRHGRHVRADREPCLEDAPCNRQVQLVVAHEQPGEEVQARESAELADRGGSAVSDFDQTRLGHSLQCLAHRRPGDTEDLRKPALAGQVLARGELAVHDLGQDLVEDLVRHKPTGDGFQGH